jgi:bifunctional DNA-binding transcriptional regulator/antitoxin component of YhaV-PrlF toxin-antitoxin module
MPRIREPGRPLRKFPDSCYSDDGIGRESLRRFAMTVTVKNRADLVVPLSVQRRAGIKTGDRLTFKVTAHSILITPVEPPSYKPTKTELAAIRKGEAEIARGEYVTLSDILHDLDRPRRKRGAETARKASR